MKTETQKFFDDAAFLAGETFTLTQLETTLKNLFEGKRYIDKKIEYGFFKIGTNDEAKFCAGQEADGITPEANFFIAAKMNKTFFDAVTDYVEKDFTCYTISIYAVNANEICHVRMIEIND